MSGFLQRLVDRHVGGPVIRPRATVRFPPANAGETFAPRFDAASPVSHELAPPVVERPTAPRIVDATGAEGAEGSVPVQRASVSSPPIMARSEPPQMVAQPSDHADRPGVPPPEHVVALHHVGDQVTTGASVHLTAPQPAPSQVEASTPARVTPSIVTARPSVAPTLVRSDTSRRETTGHQSAPDVVQVHIGRVEVRAVMPPTPSPRTRVRREPPALSLDQYLAGKRRP